MPFSNLIENLSGPSNSSLKYNKVLCSQNKLVVRCDVAKAVFTSLQHHTLRAMTLFIAMPCPGISKPFSVSHTSVNSQC